MQARGHRAAFLRVTSGAKRLSAWRLSCSFTSPGVKDPSPARKAELQRWAARPGWTRVSSWEEDTA